MKDLTLLCAATGVEAKACRQAGDMEICLTGIGMKRAREVLGKRLDNKNLPVPVRIISTGFAGTSIADLPVGSWIVGKRVGRVGSEQISLPWQKLESALTTSGLFWRSVDITSVEKVVSFADVKEALVVDMESFALAEVAGARGIEFQVLRLVSDTPAQPIPEAIGLFASGRLLRGAGQAIGSPLAFASFLARGSRLPRMLRDGWRALIPLL
jgi:4-hydroxy-3-methylbut-2-en-1-yl diphosphate reductase